MNKITLNKITLNGSGFRLSINRMSSKLPQEKITLELAKNSKHLFLVGGEDLHKMPLLTYYPFPWAMKL